jgi:phage shock protein C
MNQITHYKMEPKRFYRSTTDRVLGGVAAGLAEYFALDPVLIRLLFVLFALFGGGGVLVYIIFWIVIPEKPMNLNQSQPTMETTQNPQEGSGTYTSSPASPDTKKEAPAEKKKSGSLIGGLVLITVGAIFLADEFVPNVNFGDLWPLILIVIGAGLLINTFAKKKASNQ